jgi:D-alanyl-D-alanine-carboxypeptidase/D-alanyl-D-alanine-endopeptidase
VLGHILENAYGLTYGQLIKKYITGPLDMPGTQLYPTGQASLIKGYNIDKKIMPETAISYPAAGGLRSNVNDMLKYADAQLKEQDPVIKQTHHFMFSANDGEGAAMPWAIDRTINWDYFLREDGGSRGFRTMITIFPDQGIAVVVLSNETDNDAGGQLWDMTKAILNELKK